MAKFVKLLASVYVNGALRHPHEGALHLEDEEAQRLIDNQAAVDVTSDFSSEQKKETPVEALDASPVTPSVALAADAVDHQANIPVSEAAHADDAPKSKKETAK